MLAFGPRLCVVKSGANCIFFNNGQESEIVPGLAVETIDATGCGDAFIAGLLTQIVAMDKPIADISAGQLTRSLRYANAVGALTALTQGVIPALPTKESVEQFLVKQGGR